MTIYAFKVWFDGDLERDFGCQIRYVAATSEEKAIRKMEKYARDLRERGFANIHFHDPYVELENVIF